MSLIMMPEGSTLKQEMLTVADNATCEVCGRLVMDLALVPFHGTRAVQRPGYRMRITKLWHLCRVCASFKLQSENWNKWVFPVIRGVLPGGTSVADLVKVQPMIEHEPRTPMFMLDCRTTVVTYELPAS